MQTTTIWFQCPLGHETQNQTQQRHQSLAGADLSMHRTLVTAQPSVFPPVATTHYILKDEKLYGAQVRKDGRVPILVKVEWKNNYLLTNATIKAGKQTSEASQECENGGRPTGKGQNLRNLGTTVEFTVFCILLI